MKSLELDCRGQACPHPVLKTKEIVDQGVSRLTVLVDNDAARQNVSRFLERSGFQVQVEVRGNDLAVTGTRAREESSPPPAPETWEETASRKILLLVGTDRLGTGDDDLGRRLIVNFLGTVKEMGRDLWCLVLLNAGVKLAVTGSPVLAGLKELEQQGVMVLVCGTCLNHFQLLERKEVGETTNMLDIVTHMQLADLVISFT